MMKTRGRKEQKQNSKNRLFTPLKKVYERFIKIGSSCNRVGKKQHKIGIDWLWIMRNRVFIGIRNLA